MKKIRLSTVSQVYEAYLPDDSSLYVVGLVLLSLR